jgi:hypothetical protein
LKIQNKRGSTNEEVFVWLGQGVDEGPNATTLKWSRCLGCNHYYKSGVQFTNLNDYGTLKVK